MKKVRVNKVKLFFRIFIIIAAIFLFFNDTISKINSQSVYSMKNAYEYLMVEENRIDTFSAAINLNDDKSENACVYFVSEVLRRNNFTVPEKTCNTSQLITLLEKRGWSKFRDYKELKLGDVCFTTDAEGNKNGTPTHTYVFMGWVKEGSYEYAYICDNQAKDYKNKVLHIRNIKNVDKANGFTKDAFSFFMRASK